MDKEFDQIFLAVSYRHSKSSVWNDFIHMSAVAIANRCSFNQNREDDYLAIAKRYSRDELDGIAKMFTRVVVALEKDREQDFLGQLYMEYMFGDVKKGQYFTPYNIASLMTRITDIDSKDKPYITANDPACGSGVMLIAAVNKVLKQGGNPHTDLFVVA